MLEQFQYHPLVYKLTITKDELNKLLNRGSNFNKYPNHSYHWEKTDVSKKEQFVTVNFLPMSAAFPKTSKICQMAICLKYHVVSDEIVEMEICPYIFPKALSKDNINSVFSILYKGFHCLTELNSILNNVEDSEKDIVKYHFITYYFALLEFKVFMNDMNLNYACKVENSLFDKICNEFMSSNTHYLNYHYMSDMSEIWEENTTSIDNHYDYQNSKIDSLNENVKLAYYYLYQLILKKCTKCTTSFEFEDLLVEFRNGLCIDNFNKNHFANVLFYELLIKMLDRQMLTCAIKNETLISSSFAITKNFYLNPPYYNDYVVYLFNAIYSNFCMSIGKPLSECTEFFFERCNTAKKGLMNVAVKNNQLDILYSEIDIDYFIEFLKVLASMYPDKANEAILNAAYDLGRDERKRKPYYYADPLLFHAFNELYTDYGYWNNERRERVVLGIVEDEIEDSINDYARKLRNANL